jgi:hypothetical protein
VPRKKIGLADDHEKSPRTLPHITAMSFRGTLLLLPTVIAALAVSLPETVHAANQTGFDPRVVTFGAERDQIKGTPIEKRPYRPLHVYGNSVRRRQTRGR